MYNPPQKFFPAIVAETERAFERMTQSVLLVMSEVNETTKKRRKPAAATGATNQWDATVNAILAKARSRSKVLYRRIKQAIIVPRHPRSSQYHHRPYKGSSKRKGKPTPNFFQGVTQQPMHRNPSPYGRWPRRLAAKHPGRTAFLPTSLRNSPKPTSRCCTTTCASCTKPGPCHRFCPNHSFSASTNKTGGGKKGICGAPSHAATRSTAP